MLRWALNLIAVALLLVTASAVAEVPERCVQYRREMQQSAWRVFGPGAPVALLAGQTQQESGCRHDAISPAGAEGLNQFMRATSADMAKLHASCSPAKPFDPVWSINCRDRYMRALIKSQRSMTEAELSECAAWAFGLKAYNGGGGWVNRDRRKAHLARADPNDWRVVNQFNAGRKPEYHKENREYPERILRLQRRYVDAGWGRGVCQEVTL